MLHLPLLRAGREYRSVQSIKVPHFRTKETFAELSEANPGLVRRDLLDEKQEAMRAALDGFSTMELIEISARTADAFMNDTLPVGGEAQTPDDYVRQLSATTGLPHVLVRRNMEKI
jgi:hypothetical protein